MKHVMFVLTVLAAAAAAAHAQDSIPDLRGTWSGKGKTIVFGNNPYHPGSQTPADAPRVGDIEVTHVVEGQDGRLAWGHSSSTVADTKEPFAWALSTDNESIVGADMDGYFHISMLSADSMEKCYVHNGTGPTRSIVAGCYEMRRVK
jgi:hypothetical protein